MLVAVLLGATASSGGAAGLPRIGTLGIVPHAGAPQTLGALSASSPLDLTLQTQPCTLANSCWVMRTNMTYTIYWVPTSSTACSGSPCHVSTNYESLINRYFSDVAAASRSNSNVYSTDSQYYDATGPIGYQSSFGGSYVDTNPFPASGCNDGVNALCLTDQQIEDEIQNVLTTKGWHGSTTTMFFVMTPDGVGSCVDGTPPSSGGECSTNVYCAYHSGFVDTSGQPVLYANEPYNATISNCNPGSSPNGDDADAEIKTISHEHNEAITDPWGTAWWTSDPDPSYFGMENGDLCAWDFGSPLGTAINGQPYNQVINGHDYWLQQEYSNDGSSCAQRYPWEVPAHTTAPTVSGVAGEGHVLSVGTSGIWSQVPTSYTYQWLRCSSTSEISCFAFPGDTGPTYRLTAADVGKIFRLAVYATNAVGTSEPGDSAPTAVVVPIPATTSAPVVSGTAAVGKTLSTSAGGWNTSASFAYQWQRCAASGSNCTPIVGATASTYPLVAADAGHTLVAAVSTTNAAATVRAFSAATQTVVAVPKPEGLPRISGKAKVGRRISAKHGSWLWSPTAFKFQWLRCSPKGTKCHPIKGAVHTKYRLTKHDAGHRLRVRVKAVNLAGSRRATSRPTKRVPLTR